MASIPTYDEFHAQSAPLPSARQESVATPGLLSGPAQAIERAGASMQSAGADFLKVQTEMQERQNADKVFRAETALKTDYLAFEDSARKRRGQDAWGVAKDASDWWDKKTSEHADTLENPRQQAIFKHQMAGLRVGSLDKMSAYEAEQRHASLVDSANATITSSINLAAANPDAMPQARTDILNRVNVVAGINGWSAEMSTAKQAEALTNLHTQVLQNLGNENPAQAKAYYEANKAEINGSARDPIEKMLKIAGVKSTAQKAADAVLAMDMPEAEALATIRKQYDGEEEAAAVLEVKTRYEERNKMRESGQKAAADQGWDVYAKTGKISAIPATVINAMDGKDVLALRDRAEKDAEGKPIKTDFAVYYDLSRQAMDNPAAFQRVDLRRYSAVMAEADLKQLAGMQKTISQDAGKGVAEVGTQLSVAHNRLGWGDSDRDKKGAFDNAVLNQLDAQRASTGKEPTYKERQDVIDRMMIDGKLNGTGFFGTNVFPDKGKVYEFSDRSDFKKFVADIPADERKKIEGALTRNNQAITDKAVADLYARKNNLPRPNATPGPGSAPAITPPKPGVETAHDRYQATSKAYMDSIDALENALGDPNVKQSTRDNLRKEMNRLKAATDKAHEETKNGR